MMNFNLNTVGHGIVSLLFVAASNKAGFYTFSALFGWFFGVKLCLFMQVTIDMFGLETFAITAALNSLILGVSCFLGPAIGGILVDATQGFNATCYLAGFATLIGAAGYFVALWMHTKQQKAIAMMREQKMKGDEPEFRASLLMELNNMNATDA